MSRLKNKNRVLSSSRSRKTPDLDMAPMIDCVFLLLIFFMVSTTFAPMPGIRVQLPPPGRPSSDKPKGLIIRIDNPVVRHTHGAMTLNDEVIEFNKMHSRLLAEPEDAKNMLVIQAGRNVLHEQIVKVIDTAKQAGIDKIGFAVVGR